MEKNTKPSKDTNEIADKYVFPAEGKDYSDFKQMEGLLNKIAKGMETKFPNVFGLWVKNGQDREDFADFVLRGVREGFNRPAEYKDGEETRQGAGTNAKTPEAIEADTACDPADEGEDEEYTQEDADEEFQMLEDRDRE